MTISYYPQLLALTLESNSSTKHKISGMQGKYLIHFQIPQHTAMHVVGIYLIE